jgi:hypothetical protein
MSNQLMKKNRGEPRLYFFPKRDYFLASAAGVAGAAAGAAGVAGASFFASSM